MRGVREVRAEDVEVGDVLRLLSGTRERVTAVRPLNRAQIRITTSGGVYETERYAAYEVMSS